MSKRLWGLLGCLALLLSLCGGAQAGTTRRGVVVNDRPENRLHLRTLPDTQAPSLGKYYTGVEVEVLEDTGYGNWARVQVRGVEGFMLMDFLRIGADANHVTPATPTAYVNNPNPADRLNLRELPDERSESLGRFYNGTQVTVLGVAGAWYHVDVGGRSGYMRSAFLSLRGGGASTGTQYAVVKNPNPRDRLNLRAWAQTSAPSLGKYYNGVRVELLSGGDSVWVRVRVAGVEGYMQRSYLASGAEADRVQSATPTVWVLNPNPRDRLNLRAAPDASSDSLGKYYNGTSVTVLGIAGDWYHVRVDGKTGYMDAHYLTGLETAG